MGARRREGNVLLINRYGEEDHFYIRLYHPDHPGRFTEWRHKLQGARRGRSNGRVHLLQGEEWVASVKAHRLQTWLCVPTVERGCEICERWRHGKYGQVLGLTNRHLRTN